MGSMVFLIARVCKDHDGIHRSHRQEDARQTTNLPKRVMETRSPQTLIPQVVSLVRSYILLVPFRRDPSKFWVMRS